MAAAAAAVVMALGLAGILVPGLPGLPLVWLAALGYGVTGSFGGPGVIAMTVITVLFAVGIAAKYVLATRRARATGAPLSTSVAGALCGFVGFFLIPVVGFVLGAVAGVLLAEQRRLGSWSPAWSSTREVIVGFGLGILLEVAAGVVMVLVWVVWVVL